MALKGGPQALTGYPTNLPIRRFPAFVLVAVSRKSVRRFLVLMRAILYGSEKVLSVMGIYRQLPRMPGIIGETASEIVAKWHPTN